MTRRRVFREGFTLIELLLTIAIIGVIAGIVIIAIAPRKSFIAARDAERKHMAKELSSALYQHLIDEWKLAGGGQIPECTEATKGTCAKPICRGAVSSTNCNTVGGVNLSVLPPEYIAQLPVDAVMPESGVCTGYMVYQQAGRPHVFSANVGKLPGDAPGGECCGVNTDGLVGYWKLDEGAGSTAQDSAGSNDGTVTGAAWTTDAASPVICPNPSALVFDGLNDCVTMPKISGLTSATVTLWLQVPSVGSSYRVAFDIAGHSGDGMVILSSKLGDPVVDVDFGVSAGTIWSLAGAPRWGTDIFVGQWVHLALTWSDAETPTLYVNGGSDGIFNPKSPIIPAITWKDNHHLGCEGGTNKYYNGKLDDVRVYNRILTSTEIADIASGNG